MDANASFQRESKSTSPATPQPKRESFRFPRALRLRAAGDFAQVRAQGAMRQGRHLRLTVLHVPGSAAVRCGVITSRRVGSAVERNRVRRRLREIFRTHRPMLAPGIWLVVSAKHGAAAAPFDELRQEWLRLAGRLSILRASA